MAPSKDIDPYESPLVFFGHEVRRHWARLEVTQVQLGKRLYCSDDLVSKIETGEAVPSVEFAEACDKVFGTHGSMKHLAVMVRRAMVFPSWLRPWVEAEQEARTLRNWEPIVVPGLLQTADYARAVLRAGQPGEANEQIEEQVETRLERQKVLDRDNPPRLWFVVDESVLHRSAGSPEIMRAQLKTLLEATQRPHITIQVVPLSVGVHPGSAGAFWIASFNGAPDVLYLESARAGQVTDRPEDVQEIMNVWEAIRAEALPSRASLDLIMKAMEQWT